MKVGATVAIIKENKVLMTLRSDWEIWCLPGGHVDEGESVAEAAIREAREEVGVDVALTRYVGVYSRIGGDATMHLHLFTAEIVGGSLAPQPDEVLDIQFFDPSNLPELMFWWHRYQVDDALNGRSGVAWQFEVVPAVEVANRQALYDLQASMDLSPSEFYKYYFESNGTHRVKKFL
ncbi:MAG: NUDIX domain-containing protein [Chloroflexota bacterium]